MRGGTLRSLMISIGIDDAGVRKGIGRVETAVGAGAVAIVAGIGKSVEAAKEWESEFAGVRKTFDTTGMSQAEATASLATLEDQLRDMTKVMPVTHAEIAGIAEAAGALGVKAQDVDEFTNAVALLSRTTDDVSSDAGAMALGQISNLLDLTTEDYARFANTLVYLGNHGASTEGQILQMTKRIASVGKTVGMAKAEVLGWSSAIANTGMEADAGGSAFMQWTQIVTKAVATGGGVLKSYAKTAGMTQDAFRSLFRQDPSEALRRVLVGLSKLSPEAQQVRLDFLKMGDIRKSRLLTNLAGDIDNVNSSLEGGRKGWADNNAATNEAAIRFETTQSKIEIATNRINDAMITLGATLLPIIADIAEGVGQVATFIGDWMQANQGLVSALTPLVSILAGLIALKFGARLLTSLLPIGSAGRILNAAWTTTARRGVQAPIQNAVRSGVKATPGIRTAAAASGTQIGTAMAGSASGGGILGGLKRRLGGGAIGKVLGVGGAALQTAAVASFAIPLVTEVWNAKEDVERITREGNAQIDANLAEFLAGAPSAAQVDEKLAGLRSMPDKLGMIERGLFDLNVQGVQDSWRRSIQALEDYKTTAASAATSTAESVKGASATTAEEATKFAGAVDRMGRSAKRLGKTASGEFRRTAAAARRSARQTGQAFPEALTNAQGPTGSAAAGVRAQVAGSLANLPAYTWGSHAGDHLADGLRSEVGDVGSAAYTLAAAVRQYVAFSRPPRKGPLSSIRSWGPHMVAHWTSTTRRSLPAVEAVSRRWAEAATPRMGARPGLELPRATSSGGWAPGYRTAGAVSAGADGGALHLHVGTLIADDRGLDELDRRLGRRGRTRRRVRRDPKAPY